VKAFVVTSRDRFPGLPEVASASEVGLPGIEALLWFGLMAPAKTPQSIVTRLNREIRETFSRADTKDTLLKLGAIAAPSTPEEMRTFLKNELSKWTPVIKAAGIKAE
jgi:tripartite-type tricarboxylate transporter receptor subunit TctC